MPQSRHQPGSVSSIYSLLKPEHLGNIVAFPNRVAEIPYTQERHEHTYHGHKEDKPLQSRTAIVHLRISQVFVEKTAHLEFSRASTTQQAIVANLYSQFQTLPAVVDTGR